MAKYYIFGLILGQQIRVLGYEGLGILKKEVLHVLDNLEGLFMLLGEGGIRVLDHLED
jgi:hypothetical protein